MPDLARLIAMSFLSRPFRSRDACVRAKTPRHAALVRVTGGVVAAALLLFTAGIVGAPLDGTGQEWTDAPVVHALPAVHSRALQHGELDSRNARVAAPHASVPLAAATAPSIAFARTSVALAEIRVRPVASVVSRGYDATAPPVS
jgi:uncharacterized protein HemY